MDGAIADVVLSLPVHEVASSWSPREFAADTLPMLFEILLNMLETVEGGHLAWLFLLWRHVRPVAVTLVRLRLHFTCYARARLQLAALHAFLRRVLRSIEFAAI